MRIRNDNGQATVITVVFLVVLLGMAALVLDIGSWYRADRSTQSTADAATNCVTYGVGNAITTSTFTLSQSCRPRKGFSPSRRRFRLP